MSRRATTDEPMQPETHFSDERQWPYEDLSGAIVWSLVIAAGFLIFEVTAEPALSVPVVGAKFAWDDFLTAWWFRKADPSRPRGRIHCWVYIALGLVKMALTAAVMLVPILALLIIFSQPNQAGKSPLLKHLAAAALTTYGGLLLAGIAATIAFFESFCRDIKVWAEPALHYSRRTNTWPPNCGSENHARKILLTSILTIFSAAGCLIAAVAWLLVEPLAQIWNEDTRIIIGFVSIGAILCAAVIAASAMNYVIERKLVARLPFECWEVEHLTEKQAV